MIKVWNVDHYDYLQTVIDADGNEVQAIIKCEMEKRMITSQGTVKIENPKTNGTIRKATYKGIEVNYHEYGNGKAYIEAVEGKPFPLLDPESLEKEGLDTHSKSKIVEFSELELPDALHPVDEAYEMEKSMAEHNESINAIPVKTDCTHEKEVGSQAGILCRDCGQVREPVTDFEKQLVGRFNFKGNGYVNYQGR